MLHARAKAFMLSAGLSLLAQQPVLPAHNDSAGVPLVDHGSAAVRSLSVESSFKNGQMLPKTFTADGADISPPLRWDDVPPATKSIAVICLDPDAPGGVWYHWLLYNLPARTVSIEQNVPKQPTVLGGAEQGLNDFNHVGYNGPVPPPGAKHRYYFRVMALDTLLSLRPEVRKEELLNAVRGHILAEGEIIGMYWR